VLPNTVREGLNAIFLFLLPPITTIFTRVVKKIPVEDDGERSLNLINPILIVATVLGRDCTHVTSCIENGVHPEENNLSPTNYLNYARVLLELS